MIVTLFLNAKVIVPMMMYIFNKHFDCCHLFNSNEFMAAYLKLLKLEYD